MIWWGLRALISVEMMLHFQVEIHFLGVELRQRWLAIRLEEIL